MSAQYQYKVVIYREHMLGSLFLNGSKVNPDRFAQFLNEHGRRGWRVKTMERESRRMLLFFQREAFIVVMERQKGA